MLTFNRDKCMRLAFFGENVIFQLVKTRVKTFMTALAQPSCWPSSFVEWPWRTQWEWPLGESERARLQRNKDYKRGNESGAEGVRDKGQEREGERGQAAGWCESASDHLVLLLHPLALSLSDPPFLPFPLTFLSLRFALLWRPVLIGDNGGDASVGAHARVRASSRCQCELKLKLWCTRTESETQTDTVSHSRGLWAKAPRRA